LGDLDVYHIIDYGTHRHACAKVWLTTKYPHSHPHYAAINWFWLNQVDRRL
jgi:hypothetical protein